MPSPVNLALGILVGASFVATGAGLVDLVGLAWTRPLHNLSELPPFRSRLVHAGPLALLSIGTLRGVYVEGSLAAFGAAAGIERMAFLTMGSSVLAYSLAFAAISVFAVELVRAGLILGIQNLRISHRPPTQEVERA